jgi:hypothetical protein
MVKDQDSRDHLSHIQFIFEKIHSGIKEVHVSDDIYKTLEKYVQKSIRSDTSIVNDTTLVLRSKIIKKAIKGHGKIAFIDKEQKTY